MDPKIKTKAPETTKNVSKSNRTSRMKLTSPLRYTTKTPMAGAQAKTAKVAKPLKMSMSYDTPIIAKKTFRREVETTAKGRNK